MLERELKLHVPAAARGELEQALRCLGAKDIDLHACYFDTPQRELAHARIALRLRLEGKQWVQTLKAPGPDELSRIETNHDRSLPSLDLSLYRGTPIEALITGLQGPLLLRYETRIKRLVYRDDTGRGIIELAYDQGTINAQGLEMTVCELELEQVSGDSDTLFSLGEQWLRRYHLIIDLRSKAERGDALAKLAHRAGLDDAQDRTEGAIAPDLGRLYKARRPGTIRLEQAQNIQDVYRECANDCLNQVIRNAGFLAGMDDVHCSEALRVDYVHQLRVGIRRLRTGWKFFSPWLRFDAHGPAADLRTNFSFLGQSRDSDVVQRVITPCLLRAGMAGIQWPARDTPHHQEAQPLAASASFQAVLLKLLHELVVANEVPAALPGREALQAALVARLNKWLKQIMHEGAHFEQLSIDAQHDLRKKVKSLRYALEFCAGTLTGKRPERLRVVLEQVQEVLGELNDLYVAHAVYKKLVVTQPHAWFALGWLSAKQEEKKAQAVLCFARVSELALLKE